MEGAIVKDIHVTALDDSVRGLISSPNIDDPREEDFSALALAMYAFQYERCLPYRRYSEAFGVTPSTVSSWREIPAIPTSAFKVSAMTTCDETVYTFRTSGTSSPGRQGKVTRDAEAQALVWEAQVAIHSAMMRPDGAALPFFSLVPSPLQLPEASIAHSVQTLMKANGGPGSRSFVTMNGLNANDLYDALRVSEAADEPVEIYGATYSLVPFLDWLYENGRRLALPDGSRLAHGSGYKGRSRELSPPEFEAYVVDRLGIPGHRRVGVLGMTELGSQFYDDVLRRDNVARTQERRMITHPWTRTRVVDPETLADQAPGVPGLLMHYDLSLRGNILAVLTEDLGIQIGSGFQIIGRVPKAEPRGCNAAMEALMTVSGQDR